MACSQGDKPTIVYKFGNGSERRYQSEFAPIEVIIKTKPAPASDNYSYEGFSIGYRTSQFFPEYFSGVVRDFYTFYRGNTLYITRINCDGSQSEGYLDRGDLSIAIDTSKKCPGAVPNQRCSIQVRHNNQLLFQDQGDCPINYSVQCGKSPEGTCECPSPIYPGYCCLDCTATAASIRTITNELRFKNG